LSEAAFSKYKKKIQKVIKKTLKKTKIKDITSKEST